MLFSCANVRSFFGIRGGGIVWGLPAALGAKLALPQRPVVALVGGGSAMYVNQALWSAARENLAVVYDILNNGSYRILKQRIYASKDTRPRFWRSVDFRCKWLRAKVIGRLPGSWGATCDTPLLRRAPSPARNAPGDHVLLLPSIGRRRAPTSTTKIARPPTPQRQNAALTLHRSATTPIRNAAIGKQPPWISM